MNTGTFVIFIERETPFASLIFTSLGKNLFSSKAFIFLLFFSEGGYSYAYKTWMRRYRTVRVLDNNLTVGPSPRTRYGIVAVGYPYGLLLDVFFFLKSSEWENERVIH